MASFSTVTTASNSPVVNTQAVARRRHTDSAEVEMIIRALLGIHGEESDAAVLGALAIAAALGMHRGSFGIPEYAAAVRLVGRSEECRGFDERRVLESFRRLRRYGVIPTSQGNRRRLIFHEGFAEACIDRLSSRYEFVTAFRVVGKQRLRSIRADSPAERWLVSAELNESQAASDLFDAAAAAGGYGRMVGCLDRLALRSSLDRSFRIQHAIVLDRVGRFHESRQEFDSVEIPHNESGLALRNMLLSGRIEAAHDERALRQAAILKSHPDATTSAIGEYWQLHMAAHHGSFAPERLEELADQLQDAWTADPSHWLHYATLRTHVDSLRHLYLSGRADASTVRGVATRRRGEALRAVLAVTEGFETLYGRAHYIGHVLLPNIAIYRQLPSAYDGEITGMTGTPNVEELIKVGLAQYRLARAQFGKFGDREAHYLQADELNLTMVAQDADLTAARAAIGAYKEFIEATGFGDIASYPDLYLFRWHILAHFDALLSGPGGLADSSLHLEQAREALGRVIQFDERAANRYGLFRAKLLRDLTYLLQEPVNRAWVEQLQKDAISGGYGIERKLAAQLARGGISQLDLRAIFRFYPIVHQ